MHWSLHEEDAVMIELWAAGSLIPEAESLIRRYCGMPDERGRAEVWGYAYYDALLSEADNEVTPWDVLTTSALGMRFSQPCLQGWAEARPILREALAELPGDLSILEATDEHLELIEEIIQGIVEGSGRFACRVPDSDRTMASKVLHRKRRALVPLYDRVISDRYARGHGDKRLGKGVALMRLIREDVRANVEGLARIGERLEGDLGEHPVPKPVRLLDIAMWMESRAPPTR